MAQQAFYTKINAGAGVQFSGGTIAQATGVLHTNNVLYLRGGSSGLFLQNSDGSDGIFVANDHVQITTASAERMRIDSLGQVGIGDQAPTIISANTFSLSVNSARNDLSGALVSKSNGTAKLQQYWDSSGYNHVLTTSSGDFKWFFGGTEKMRLTETGDLNVVAGKIGLNDGNSNVFVGEDAGEDITTGQNNVAIGVNALKQEAAGGRSVAIGKAALAFQKDGSTAAYNIGIGYEAGLSINTGLRNTLIGGLAGDALTTGSDNVAIGYLALSNETEDGKNVAIGKGALQSQRVAADGFNVGIGYNAGINVSTGANQVLIGGNAGVTLTDGANNVAIGRSA